MQLIEITHTILKDGGKSVFCFKIENFLFSSHIVEKSLNRWFLTVTFVSPLKEKKCASSHSCENQLFVMSERARRPEGNLVSRPAVLMSCVSMGLLVSWLCKSWRRPEASCRGCTVKNTSVFKSPFHIKGMEWTHRQGVCWLDSYYRTLPL